MANWTILCLILFVTWVNAGYYEDELNDFAIQHFWPGVIRYKSGVNFAASPLSSYITFSLLSLGASSFAKSELQKALFLSHSSDTTILLPPIITAVGGKGSKFSNGIFIDDKISPFKTQFTTDANNIDSTIKLGTINFSLMNAARNTINSWLNIDTGGIIPEIESIRNIRHGPTIVANGNYFKDRWSSPFETTTRKEWFNTGNFRRVQVDMMHQINNFKYAHIPQFSSQVIELQLKDGMAMIVILNDHFENRASDDYTSTVWNNILSSLQTVSVEVFLPKFEILSTHNLVSSMQSARVYQIFDRRYNQLTDVADKRTYLRYGFQNDYILVNENGIGPNNIREPDPPQMVPTVKFIANRPFTYFIKDTNNVITFFGKFTGIRGRFEDFDFRDDSVAEEPKRYTEKEVKDMLTNLGMNRWEEYAKNKAKWRNFLKFIRRDSNDSTFD